MLSFERIKKQKHQCILCGRLLEPCILKPRLVRHAKMCVPQHVNVPFTHKVNKKAIFRSPGLAGPQQTCLERLFHTTLPLCIPANYIFCWMASFSVTDVWIVLNAPCHNGCYLFIWMLDCRFIYAAFYQMPAGESISVNQSLFVLQTYFLQLQECTFWSVVQNLVCYILRVPFKVFR